MHAIATKQIPGASAVYYIKGRGSPLIMFTDIMLGTGWTLYRGGIPVYPPWFVMGGWLYTVGSITITSVQISCWTKQSKAHVQVYSLSTYRQWGIKNMQLHCVAKSIASFHDNYENPSTAFIMFMLWTLHWERVYSLCCWPAILIWLNGWLGWGAITGLW